MERVLRAESKSTAKKYILPEQTAKPSKGGN